MAKRKGKKGGPRYKKVCISLPKRIYSVLKGIAMGDEKRMNRLIKIILDEKLKEATIAELETYISGSENEQEIEAKETETV
jgi:hypothetical protein